MSDTGTTSATNDPGVNPAGDDADFLGLSDDTLRDLAGQYFGADTPAAPAAPAGSATDPLADQVAPGTDLPPNADLPPTTPSAGTPPAADDDDDDYTPPGGPLTLDDDDPTASTATPSSTPPITPGPGATPPASTDDLITLPDGRKLSLSRIQSLVDLDQRALNAPSQFRPPPPAPAAPVPPPTQRQALPQFSAEDLELMDPGTRALLAFAQNQQQELAQLRQTVNATQQFAINQQQESVGRLVTTTSAQFKQQFGLDDELMDKLNLAAANSGLHNRILETGVDPITGTKLEPTQRSIPSAIWRALEIAYWATPEGRTREMRMQRDRDARSTVRKQRNAALVGSSGSTSRTPERTILSESDMRNAAIEEIAASMFQGESNNAAV